MRLREAAEEFNAHLHKTKGKMPDAYDWLLANNLLYVLRRLGVKRTHRLAHDECGRKLRDHYLPHIPIDAQVWARTWKVFREVKMITGCGASYNWERFILPLLEREILKGMRK